MKKSVCFTAVLALLSVASAHASSGAEGGGGLPVAIIPADVNFDCNAKLGIYVIDGDRRHYASFGSSFALKAKKGDRTAMTPGVTHSFSADEWKLDQATAENVDAAVVADVLSRSHGVTLNFRMEDYTKTDEVDVTAWLDVPSPYELFTIRSTRLSASSFDNSVYFKVRQPEFYSSTSLEVSCRHANQ